MATVNLTEILDWIAAKFAISFSLKAPLRRGLALKSALVDI
jgi:hypothetical protein